MCPRTNEFGESQAPEFSAGGGDGGLKPRPNWVDFPVQVAGKSSTEREATEVEANKTPSVSFEFTREPRSFFAADSRRLDASTRYIVPELNYDDTFNDERARRIKHGNIVTLIIRSN